jgi:hypothetical protein
MPKDLDPATINALINRRGTAAHLRPMAIPQNAPPTVTAGIPGLKMYEDPFLEKTNSRGYMIDIGPRTTDAIFLKPNLQNPERGVATMAHEAEHLLAKRQLDSAGNINQMFDKLSDNPKFKDLRTTFVQDASKAFPYIQEKYGIESGYFDPKMLKFQGPLAPNLAYEQLAVLASIEATTGVDLTKDPYLRKNLFKNREVREIYNALTGLRQTRLDAKDLPPHTRIKEKDSGRISDYIESIKKPKFSAGGLVDKPLLGGSKLI